MCMPSTLASLGVVSEKMSIERPHVKGILSVVLGQNWQMVHRNNMEIVVGERLISTLSSTNTFRTT